jgi:asparagine synthase (glutamine-hydrolysing)
MCGLAGFTRVTGPRDAPDVRALLERMLAPIAYRGPDETGFHIDSGIALGHLRLTIIAPDGGAQPRVDEASGDALAFNGEIYGYRAHAETLKRDGVSLRDRSDTEVLFQMIRRFGVEGALERLDGMFAFVYRDGKTGTVTLARDRFGEKPLCYGTAGGQIVFASEVKSLRCHPAFADAPFDHAAIGQYLSFDYIPGARTPFAGISRVRPGHVVSFKDGRIEERAYFRLAEAGAAGRAAAEAESEAACVDRFDALLDRSVRDRLIADVPVGVFLSGGIDSSLIAALASRHAPGLTAFTIQMDEDSYDETPFARAVAQRYGLRHEVERLAGGELIRALDAVEAKLDEPFADSSIVPTFLVCEFARRHVTVALGGDGGDELFAGYAPFKLARYQAAMACLPRAAGRALRGMAAHLPSGGGYMSLDFVLGQLAAGFGQSAPSQTFHWMASFDDHERASLLADDVRASLSADLFQPVADLLAASPGAPFDDSVGRMQYLFTALYLPGDILFKVDRASMYNSLEVRAPFLDRAVAEAAFALPSRLKLKGGTTKYLLKRLAERHLPRDLVHRPKHGFAVPVAGLLRGALRDRVADTLLDRANPLASWFKRPALETMLRDHGAGRRDHRKRLWALYSLMRFAATDAARPDPARPDAARK